MSMLDYLLESGIKSIVFWLVGAVVLGGGVWMLDLGPTSVAAFPDIPEDTWQAVFLNDDQVYFGKLKDHDANYLTLSEVYYLRTTADLESSSNLNLIKLGGELHGPEDTIFIPKESVLFWENMKESSRVVQSIEGAKQ